VTAIFMGAGFCRADGHRHNPRDITVQMHGGRTILVDLALVLSVAAVTTILFRRLRQPVVLGYVLAGVIVGPHIPIPLFVDPERIHTLSELGVILVMFSVGLELSIRQLVRVLPTAGPTGLIQQGAMLWLGYLVGQAFGWTTRESMFCGAMVAISSTMVVAKVFAEQGVRGKVSELVFGVLVMQDLSAVLLLALLTALSSGAGVSGTALFLSSGRLIAFLLGMVIAGFVIVPRFMRFVRKLRSPETLLVTSIGLCFGLAVLAQELGYSVALGAFVAGSLVAESGEGERVEQLVRSVRDVFAAVFFVSVGMIVDPGMIVGEWPAVVVLTLVVLIGQVGSVSLGCFLSGNDVRTSIQAGMSLAQIGEFSFIIAGVGVKLGAIRPSLYPVGVAVAVITTFITPWFIRISKPVALYVDRRLPKRLQTFATLYGGWLEQLRGAKKDARGQSPGRLIRLMLLDAAAIAFIVIGVSVNKRGLLHWLAGLGFSRGLSIVAMMIGAFTLCAPFLFGILSLARSLGRSLTAALWPSAPAAGEGGTAPPRALLVTVQLAIVLLVGLPLLALTQPFLPALYGSALFAVILAALGVTFWRSAENLQEHVRAGAEIIVAALARQAEHPERLTLENVHPLLPTLGDLTPVNLLPTCAAVGKTLGQLNLRGLTGATVVAITRGTKGIVPTAMEILQAGDVLALAGSHEVVEHAVTLLRRGRHVAGQPENSEAPVAPTDSLPASDGRGT
jgi:CPA2 family monovalent cation:H+ antiporter-2